LTGKPVQKLQTEKQIPNPIIKIGMSFSDRKLLHSRVAQRFEIMVEKGLLDEVSELIQQFSPENSAFRMIGYRQAIDHLNGDLTLTEFLDKSTAATRQLAKRQLTWMRNQSNLIWWVDDSNFVLKEYAVIKELIASYGFKAIK